MNTGIKSRDELIVEIAQALQENNDYFDSFNYIDIANNEVRMSIDEIDVAGELFPKDGEDIVRIEPLGSRESFGCMEDFADQVDNKQKQETLYRALNRRHPFSNFRYAVDDTDLLQNWYHFRDEWYKGKAEEWMTTMSTSRMVASRQRILKCISVMPMMIGMMMNSNKNPMLQLQCSMGILINHSAFIFLLIHNLNIGSLMKMRLSSVSINSLDKRDFLTC